MCPRAARAARSRATRGRGARGPGGSGASSLRLRHGPVTIQVESEDRASLDWLAEFLRPAFRAVAVGRRGPQHVVRVRAAPRRHAALERRLARATLRGLDGFTFDGEFSRHRGWRDAEGTTWVHDDACDAFYGVGPGAASVAVVARRAGPRLRLALMRVVRELATSALLRAGQLPLHGAAFVAGGGAILVCGPKRAGKTSLLVEALRCGEDFLSNDRVFVDPRGPPRALPMPTIVMLRDGTLSRSPALRAAFDAARFDRARTIAECAPGVRRPAPRAGKGFDRPGISPAQFCRLLGARMRAAAPVRAILFPRIDPRTPGIALRRLSPAAVARALASCLVKPSDPVRPSAVFAPAQRRDVLPARLERDRRRRLAALVAGFECRLGPDACGSDLRRLLARLPGVRPARARRAPPRGSGGR